MADIDLDRDRGAQSTTAPRTTRAGDRPDTRATLISRTEARRSFQTTELWLTLAMVAALLIAGYADEDGLRIDWAWALSSGVLAFYLLSRGIAKAGSSDPKIHTVDVD